MSASELRRWRHAAATPSTPPRERSMRLVRAGRVDGVDADATPPRRRRRASREIPRRHGQAHSMFKQTEHDKLLHGTLEKPEPPPSVESTDSEIWSTLRLLMRTLNAKNTKKKKYDKADVWRDWARLFDALGGPDRVTWATFSSAAKALVGVEDQALAALWTRADDDKSGELGRGEFQRCAYTIQVQSWPSLEGDELLKVVATLNASAERLHRCGGNWFKIFRLFDDDDSGPFPRPVLRCGSSGSLASRRWRRERP